jgi:hypothetical protein
MIDFQGDIIDHRKRTKSLGQAAQLNRRQSSHSHALVLARISARLGMPVYGQKREAKGRTDESWEAKNYPRRPGLEPGPIRRGQA